MPIAVGVAAGANVHVGIAERNVYQQEQFVDQIARGLDPLVTLTMRRQAPSGPDVVAVMRNGQPQYFQVADPILFLAGPAARMITGVAFTVDGGVLVKNDVPYEEYFRRR